jgi:predicted O-methyltransferase YrrM
MTEPQWTAVDRYFSDLLIGPDPVLEAALKAGADAGLPQIQVSPVLGHFLHVLARIQGARNILEIGTLAAYSTIWLARALAEDGKLITLEFEPKHAAVARSNIDRAGLSRIVELIEGPALQTLPKLEAQRRGPFDLTFIDADKESTPEYFQWALRLSRPGSLIIVDNVIRDGAVTDAASTDPAVRGMRRFFEMAAAEPRVMATAIQTVGSKKWDGFAVVRVGEG